MIRRISSRIGIHARCFFCSSLAALCALALGLQVPEIMADNPPPSSKSDQSKTSDQLKSKTKKMETPKKTEPSKVTSAPKAGDAPTVIRSAKAASNSAKKIVTLDGITEYHLENGLKILLFPDSSRPSVTVNLTVFVGSRHEGYGEAGMAHLLEHMVFKGTPTNPKVPAALQARGAKFNGTTWLDRTNYYETLPATPENLEFAIRLEADRMVNSFIKGEDLASEMTVVRNEFERGENSPDRILGQRMMAVAYEWHNYGKSTIGNRSDIERVPVESLREFYRKYYQPDNAMLVVAGKFDEASALRIIEESFGALPRPSRKLELTYTEEPAQDGERNVTLRRVGDVAIAGVLYHIPAGPHPDFAAVEVLENLLTSSPSGLLYQALVETRKAASISGAAFALHDPGIMRIMAEVSVGNDAQVVLDTITDVLAKVAEGGVTEKDVERSKVQLIKHREMEASDTSSIAVELSEWAAQGDWRLYGLHLGRVEHVTLADVKRVAQKYLQRNNLTIGLFLPTEKPQRIEIPATPSLNDMLADYKGRDVQSQGEEFEVSPDNIEARTKRVKLAPGIDAALLSKKTKGEVVQLRLAVRYGTAESLAELATATDFLGELMAKGTKDLTRAELQDELDRQKASLTAMGTAGAIVIAVETRRKNLPAVLDLVRKILREPRLDAGEFEVLKNRELAELESHRTEPQAVASKTLQRLLNRYPATDVRYVPTIEEEIERVKNLKLESVQKLYTDFLGSQAVQLSLVGDFDAEEITPKLQALFTDWKATQPYARIPRLAPDEFPAGSEAIEIPDKPNATYYAALSLALKDDQPDYPALVIGDYVLGAGALSSRLGDRIRQREGLSYGVRSGFTADAFDPRASLTVMAICNPDNIGKVELAVREEIELLVNKGLKPDELAKAKQGYLQGQQVNRTEDSRLVQQLNMSLYTGRTMAFQRDLEARIGALTVEEVQGALKKYIDAKKLHVVKVG
ncbi:MAG: peptidase domain protein, partial [Planctomycetaceae bacterium]|nr:peptidase domain protein [Planctomycetaceae bacterium]